MKLTPGQSTALKGHMKTTDKNLSIRKWKGSSSKLIENRTTEETYSSLKQRRDAT
jgi:hypothetical protein